MTSPRLILVDTNCFIRLYCSPVLPLLGETVGGYQLLTLKDLVDEFLESSNLTHIYPWVASAPKVTHLADAALKLSSASRKRVAEQKSELGPFAKAYVNDLNSRKGMKLSTLSRRDLELLATAVAMRAVIATDERALQLIARHLMEDADDYPIDVLSSLEVIHLLEMNGRLTADERRNTVATWVRLGERLPMSWRSDYERLFNESSDCTADC